MDTNLSEGDVRLAFVYYRWIHTRWNKRNKFNEYQIHVTNTVRFSSHNALLSPKPFFAQSSMTIESFHMSFVTNGMTFVFAAMIVWHQSHNQKVSYYDKNASALWQESESSG